MKFEITRGPVGSVAPTEPVDPDTIEPVPMGWYRVGVVTAKLLGLTFLCMVCGLLGKYDFDVETIYAKVLRKTGLRPVAKTDTRGLDSRNGWIRDPAVGWEVETGYDVRLDSGGYSLPVGITFVTDPGEEPTDPLYYVNELYGRVVVVCNDRTSETYAADLLNYTPEEVILTPQHGLMGICYDDATGGLIATRSYRDPRDEQLHAQVVRLRSDASGRRCVGVDVLLDLYPEITVPSHTIQQPAIGPDGRIYVPIGDAENPAWAQDLDAWAGKVLRMDRDGAACADNPFYDAVRPDAPRSYVWAYGFRNPGACAWSTDGTHLYVTDVGPVVDRLVKVTPGMSHGWGPPATNAEMRINALYTFGPMNQSPYGLVVLGDAPLGPHKRDTLLVGLFGNPEDPHHHGEGKEIDQFPLNRQGMIGRSPAPLLRNPDLPNISMHSITCLAVGPDGVYFTDLFGNATGGLGKARQSTGTGQVWKITWDGVTANRGPDYALQFPGWNGASHIERGAQLFDYYSCHSCHAQSSWIGRVGPSLDRELPSRIDARIHADGYERDLRAFLADDSPLDATYRPAFDALLSSQGTERVRRWLFWHLKEPRFDNRQARMPRYELADDEIDYLVAYLMRDRDAE